MKRIALYCLCLLITMFAYTVYAEQTEISLSGNRENLLVGEQVSFCAHVGDKTETAVIWRSSNIGVATVDIDGNVTALAPGSALICAENESGMQTQLQINVGNAPEYFELSPSSLSLVCGDTYALAVKVNKDAGTGCEFVSSDENVAHVDANGIITATGGGKCTITAKTANGCSSECVVMVSSVTINNISSTMGCGEWRMLTCSIQSNNEKHTFKYSTTDQKVLSVSSEGKLIALKQGTADVIVTVDNGLTASYTVTVMGRPSSLKLSMERTTLGAGEKIQLTATMNSGAAGKCTYRSKKTSVAVIDENGIITALKKGEAVIEVTTYNMISQKITVKVIDAPTSVEISESTMSLGIGQLYSMFAKTNNGTGNYSFSSDNPNVAEVTEKGLVTGVNEGKCTITVTSYNGVTDTCAVTVCPEPEGLWAWIDRNELGAGETLPIETQVEPYAENSVSVSYESSDDAVASVSSNGVITAHKAGSAEITAYTYNGIVRTMELLVGEKPTSIAINTPSNVVAVGETVDWSYTLNDNALGSVSVECSNENVLFAGDGVLIGVSAGTAILKLTTYNGITASAVINVMEKADSLSFINSIYSMEAGRIKQISAVVPENTCANISYSLPDDGICCVLKDGSILALKNGETTLTATALDGKLVATTIISVTGNSDIIDLTKSGLTFAECRELQSNYPELTFLWQASAFGVTVRSTDEKLDLSNNKKVSNPDNVRKLLDLFPRISWLDLSFTGLGNEDLAVLRDEYRDSCKIVWTITIANRWNIRTDQTAFSTLLGQSSVRHSSAEFDALKYCEDMLALDIGHNKIRKLDFLLGMPHLKIIILSDNDVSDISILGQLTELEYVELFTNNITDITPLENLTNLIDLNISNNNITDISPIMGLNTLQRVWMTHIKASDSQKTAFKSLHPDCEVNTTAKGPDRHGWRSHHNYFVIYKIFHTNEWIPWETEVEPAPNYQAYY